MKRQEFLELMDNWKSRACKIGFNRKYESNYGLCVCLFESLGTLWCFRTTSPAGMKINDIMNSLFDDTGKIYFLSDWSMSREKNHELRLNVLELFENVMLSEKLYETINTEQ
jgi:hypothetical protein